MSASHAFDVPDMLEEFAGESVAQDGVCNGAGSVICITPIHLRSVRVLYVCAHITRVGLLKYWHEHT
ncbi:hypothetical protein Q7P35_003027 [Cladosporium inversicolor]